MDSMQQVQADESRQRGSYQDTAAPASSPAPTPPPTSEAVAVRAYFLWLSNAIPDGDATAHWLRAEHDVWEEYRLVNETDEQVDGGDASETVRRPDAPIRAD